MGCLDASGDGDCEEEASGTLYFEISYSGTPVGNGRCHHPIVGGEGAFAGATGQLAFKDRLGACGIVETTYKGHISLPWAISCRPAPSAEPARVQFVTKERMIAT